jgi:hypothetical protein
MSANPSVEVNSKVIVGLVLGAFVAVAGLATLVGMPWKYVGGLGVAALRALGAVLAVGVGVGLAWLALSE